MYIIGRLVVGNHKTWTLASTLMQKILTQYDSFLNVRIQVTSSSEKGLKHQQTLILYTYKKKKKRRTKERRTN